MARGWPVDPRGFKDRVEGMLRRGGKFLAQVDRPPGRPLRVMPLRELTDDEALRLLDPEE